MNKLDAPSQSKIITEIRELFDRDGPTFVDLADGERSDLNALLDFYSAPLRFIGSNFHMVMKDNEALPGEEGIGGEVGRVGHPHFFGGMPDKRGLTDLYH